MREVKERGKRKRKKAKRDSWKERKRGVRGKESG